MGFLSKILLKTKSETRDIVLTDEEQLTLNKMKYRNNVCELIGQMYEIDGAMIGDAYPLKHTFGDGIYVREITMPTGLFVVSKIHKYKHPYFVLKGDVSVLTENGWQRIVAPFSGITEVGTQRILYIHDECVWTTIHRTNKTDLAEIENEIIAKDYSEIPLKITKNLKRYLKKEEICLLRQ